MKLKKIITLALTLITIFAFGMTTHASSNHQPDRFQFGISSAQFINKYPDAKELTLHDNQENKKTYYFDTTYNIFDEEVQYSEFTFVNDKLARVKFYYKATPEIAQNIINEIFRYPGTADKPVLNKKKSKMLIEHKWNKRKNTDNVFYFNYDKANPQKSEFYIMTTNQNFYKNH